MLGCAAKDGKEIESNAFAVRNVDLGSIWVGDGGTMLESSSAYVPTPWVKKFSASRLRGVCLVMPTCMLKFESLMA